MRPNRPVHPIKSALTLSLLVASCVVLPIGATEAAPPPTPQATPPAAKSESRWTDETPDGMIDLTRARALVPKAPERDVVAAIVTIAAISDRAAEGRAAKALDDIGHGPDVSPEAREEALLLARSMSADEGTAAGIAADRARGVVTDLAILGPFRDTGGGIDAKEGPEAAGAGFADANARYAWGTVEVAWRAVPMTYASAGGVPLDLFVHPRKESCSIFATRLTLDRPERVVVRLAATGTARLMFDGTELGKSEDVNSKAWLDRLGARADASAGPHTVYAKVCTSALADEGRVRFRITDEKGAPTGKTSSDLRGAAAPSGPKAPRTVVLKMTTPLTRTLVIPAGIGLDAQLDAAIVRTLGGADDFKSPRAQGILDGIVRHKDLDPDRQAMSGWIAPSGANRTGWLNSARARAATAGDTRTLGFVERRQIAERLLAHMPDWAMAARRASMSRPGARSDDAESVLMGALIDQGLGTDALRTKALHDLTALFRAGKEKVPDALVYELARLASGFDRTLSLEAHEELARRGHRGPARVDAMASRGSAAVVDAAKTTFDGNLEDADDGVAIARAVSRAGAHDASRALYAKMVEWAPNRADAWGGLADEIAATGDAARPGTESALLASLRRARELAPGEARYRAQMKLRSEGTEPDPARVAAEAHPQGDERYLASSQTILARRLGVSSDVADRELHWLRAVIMHPDNRISQLIHYAREIVIAPRTQNELFEDIPAEGDLTEILRARVHRKDGGTAFPTEEHNEGSRPRIRWPELMPGDVVEVAIRTWTSTAVGGRGDAPFYFLDYAGAPSTHPLLYNEVIVEAPTSHPIYVDVLNGGQFKKTERDENGRHITQLVWDKPPSFPEEPLSPALSEIVPVIVGSTFKTWNDFRGWYNEAIRGFTEPDGEVRRLAAELTKGKTTREAKLAALFDFVSDDIRYVNYVSGEWWLPNRPQQLLARREGDCDDKAILLITLLRAVGIEAQEVMVQTRLTGMPSIVLAKNVAIPMFDHGIAFLPGPNGGTYLDATSPQSRLGPIPSMDARAVALRMDGGPGEIVRLPASSPDDHGADVTWTIALHADGSGDLTGEERHIGDGAFYLRTYLTQKDARVQYVEDNLVGGWFPTVEVDKQVDFKGDLPKGQAWVKYKAHSDGLARHEQGELVLPISQAATLASQLAPLVKRTQPVSLPPNFAPSHNTRTIRVIAPQGFHFGDLPPGGDENGGEFGRAHLEFARDAKDPRAVIIKRSVVFDQSLIPVEKYAAWRAWVQRVDALMHKGVRLVGGSDARPPETMPKPLSAKGAK